MNRWLAVILTCVLMGVVIPVVQADDDPIGARLDKAKAAYEADMEKYRAAVASYFDRREEAARKDGDKDAVDQVKADRQAFDEKGDLPRSAPAALKSRLAKDRLSLEAAYKSAVRDYTRASQDDHATAVEKELAAFTRGRSRPDDAVKFGGKFYKVFNTNLTWREASKKCEEMGGHLAVIDSAEENAFVAELAAKTTAVIVWIGGVYDLQTGKWHWVNGKQLTFTNWGPQQPNGFNDASNPEYFVSMTVPHRGTAAAWKGKWADLSDRAYDARNGFVCEWD